MVKLLSDKSAVVTGAARGIGRAIALELARHGTDVLLCDLDGPAAEAAAARIADETGMKVIGDAADVTRKSDAERTIARAVSAFGKLDILVNNAGIHRARPFVDYDESDWDLVFAVNAKGTFLFSQAAARVMIPRRSGRIINIASASAKKPDPEMCAYNASKSAVVGLTRCMALELGPHGITVNAICPGATDTEMLRDVFAALPGLEATLRARTPLGHIAQPRDQANVVVFLASDLAAHVTGESLIVAGGELMSQ